jgi:predicted dehydrogenase
MSQPSQPLPLAFVGLSFGRHVLDQLLKSPAASLFKVAAVCDLNETLLREVSTKYGIPAYASLEQILQDDSIKVVGLYTQPAGRAKLIQKILRAGKDVMTTKPFELEAEPAEAVLAEAQMLGRVIHLNSPGPEPTRDLLQITAWAEEFDLGRLVSARGEIWAPYFEKADGSWMDDPLLCPGGAMMRLGIYLVNDIVHLAGPMDEATLVATRIRTGRPTPDNALLTMSFASGCLASVYASFCVDDGDRYANGLSLQYERGTITRNIGTPRELPKAEKAHLTLVMRDGDNRRVMEEVTLTDIFGIYQWENFYKSVTQGKSIDDKYVRKIVEGVRVLEAMRGHLTAA